MLLVLLNMLVQGESFGFSTLQLSNIAIIFLLPNVTNVVQPLH